MLSGSGLVIELCDRLPMPIWKVEPLALVVFIQTSAIHPLKQLCALLFISAADL